MKKFLSDAALSWNTQIGRNTFDKSKKHFASYNLGKLYPMFVQHCQANETIKVRPSMAFDLEPMTHELYNDLKCNTAWFKVNTRSLWSSWRKFCRQDPTKSSNIPHPYISRSDNWCTVGSLANHMGIPVASYGIFDGNTTTSFISENAQRYFDSTRGFFSDSANNLLNFQPFVYRDSSTLSIIGQGVPYFMPVSIPASVTSNLLSPLFDRSSRISFSSFLSEGTNSTYHTHSIVIGQGFNTLISDSCVLTLPHVGILTNSLNLNVSIFAGRNLESSTYRNSEIYVYSDSSAQGKWFVSNVVSSTIYPVQSHSILTASLKTQDINIKFTDSQIEIIKSLQQTESFVTVIITPQSTGLPSIDNLDNSFSVHGHYAGEVYLASEESTSYSIISGFYGFPRYTSVQEVNEVSNSPFVGSNPNLKLNALPFRAYENIYNSHFRDLIHDPFRDGNGDIYVDQYVANMGDGADSSTSVDFKYCRFEPDLFNTCLPTPTMGDNVERPLVGITVGSDPGNYTLNYQADGKAYSFDVNTHEEGSQTVIDSLASTHSEDNNNLTYLTLKDAIQYGISLQDLQNVRALTKWYEASYRGKGRFEYDKFIEAHFGKQPSLRENLAAEYLGGDTVYVNSMKVVNQTSTSDSRPLGATGGMANFQSKNDSISVYCDEDCYIMGIVWFTCDNVNSQSIDPMWYLFQPSDYATPEFADLGVMPILNKVVAPLQCNSAHYNDVFGYQRMYGDKIYSFDTVAGDFLTMKSDYLMQRRFDQMPALTADLAKMHPDDFTNVFVFDNSYDKIYGRWYFDVTLSTWLQQTPNAQII